MFFFVSWSELICVLRRFVTVYLPWAESTIPPFIECLRSLPNLHMLGIGWIRESVALPLENALEGFKVPHIVATVGY